MSRRKELERYVEAGARDEIIKWIEDSHYDVLVKLKMFDAVESGDYWQILRIIEEVEKYVGEYSV